MQNKRRNQIKKGEKLLIITGVLMVFFFISFLIYQNNRLKSKREEAIHLEKLIIQGLSNEQNQTQEKK